MASAGGFVQAALGLGEGFLTIKPNQRGFFPPTGSNLPTLVAQATLEEVHNDELEITRHPVQQGAYIGDHAFKLPEEVVIKCAWSNSPTGAGSLIGSAIGAATSFFPALAGLQPAITTAGGAINSLVAAQSVLTGNGQAQVSNIYNQLLALQASRVPFTVYTGKRKYNNMLFKRITVETNKEQENALFVVAYCQQIIIVSAAPIGATVSPNQAAQANPEATASIVNSGTKLTQLATTFTDTAQSALLKGATSLIPSLPGVPEAFKISLGGVTQSLTNTFNTAMGTLGGDTGAGAWTTNIADQFGNKIASSIPMVSGSNLLEQFGYLNIGGAGAGMFAQVDHAINDIPSFSSLGVNAGLFLKAAN